MGEAGADECVHQQRPLLARAQLYARSNWPWRAAYCVCGLVATLLIIGLLLAVLLVVFHLDERDNHNETNSRCRSAVDSFELALQTLAFTTYDLSTVGFVRGKNATYTDFLNTALYFAARSEAWSSSSYATDLTDFSALLFLLRRDSKDAPAQDALLREQYGHGLLPYTCLFEKCENSNVTVEIPANGFEEVVFAWSNELLASDQMVAAPIGMVIPLFDVAPLQLTRISTVHWFLCASNMYGKACGIVPLGLYLESVFETIISDQEGQVELSVWDETDGRLVWQTQDAADGHARRFDDQVEVSLRGDIEGRGSLLGAHFLYSRRIHVTTTTMDFVCTVKRESSERAIVYGAIGVGCAVTVCAIFFLCLILLCLDRSQLLAQDMKLLAKQREVDRVAAERAGSAKSEFLACMSHELRTPLNGILGSAAVLEQSAKNKLDTEEKQHLHQLQYSGDVLLAMVDDVLDLCKIDASKMLLDLRYTTIADLILGTVRVVNAKAQAKEVDLNCEIEGEVPQCLLIDPVRLRQVILNLVANAVKFTPQGGNVTVRASYEKADTVVVDMEEGGAETGYGGGVAHNRKERGGRVAPWRIFSHASRHLHHGPRTARVVRERSKADEGEPRPLVASAECGVLCVAVEDTGVGIPEEVLPRIFEKFVQADTSITRRFGGSGLGLTISRRLTDLMGGELTVASRVGIGSCFTMRIPARYGAPEMATDDSGEKSIRSSLLASIYDEGHGETDETSTDDMSMGSRSESMSPALPEMRALVVDDNVINRKIAVRMLEMAGLSCTCACDGEEGAEVAEMFSFAIIFMDLHMPKLTGEEAAVRIRAGTCNPHTPIVMLTADSEYSPSANISDVLVKPLRPTDIASILKRHT